MRVTSRSVGTMLSGRMPDRGSTSADQNSSSVCPTGDTTPIKWSKTEIPDIDQVLAGKLGLQAKDIEIRKLAVNPASGKAYIALQSLKTKASVIVTIDGAGNLADFALDRRG